MIFVRISDKIIVKHEANRVEVFDQSPIFQWNYALENRIFWTHAYAFQGI